jgi:hypothetical protein
MNEDRIEELAQEADKWFEEDENSYSRPAWNEKFMELIVQECILVIVVHAQHIHAEGTIEAIVNLEKHFGVE